MNRRSATRLIGSLVGVGGVAFSLTLFSRSMRAVQSIGGSCASGGAFQFAHHCPKGTAGVLTLSIFGGLLFLLLFAICAGDTGRSLLLLAWPALFLSLGWNFLDYGLHVTTTGSGVSGGFLVCGVLFIVMGAVPLIWLLPQLWKVITGRSDPPGAPGHVPFVGATSVQFNPPASSSPPAWGTGTSVRMASPPAAAPAATTPSTGKDVAGELERLASLHRRGELTDAEYEAAKAQAIANTGKPT
jgi:Short C-terminal domain